MRLVYSEPSLVINKFCNKLNFLCSNEDKLHYGTIICSLGVRYKFYCSNVVRTMLYEPSQVGFIFPSPPSLLENPFSLHPASSLPSCPPSFTHSLTCLLQSLSPTLSLAFPLPLSLPSSLSPSFLFPSFSLFPTFLPSSQGFFF